MTRYCNALLAIPLLLGISCAPAPKPASLDPAAHRAEVEAWRAERNEDLRSPDGWLALTGLFWLREGDNRFGADAGNDLVFPGNGVPGTIGVLHRAQDKVTLKLTPGVALAADGSLITVPELPLAADADGKPTMLSLGTLKFYVIRRGERVGVRLKDAASPVLAGFEGVEAFAIDPAWRVEARFEPYQPPKKIRIPNVLGDVAEEDCPGALVFEHAGQTLRLEPTGEGGGEMFLVFGDATNGHETYGGGRFLAVPAPSADGKVIVDFNRAYNPPCVFTPYATCPLPPRQNRMPIRVEAGDKMYAKGIAHAVDAP